jgi:hypothetical protein
MVESLEKKLARDGASVRVAVGPAPRPARPLWSALVINSG